jgi:hypothetical protein
VDLPTFGLPTIATIGLVTFSPLNAHQRPPRVALCGDGSDVATVQPDARQTPGLGASSR